jgi:CRP-like cAMP-binding protein
MLEALSEETVRKLTGKGFLMDVPAGQLLTEKGLSQQEIFVILDGAFEVDDGDRRLRVIGQGDVIGEIGFFGSSGRRSASVTAASDGQVLVLRRRFVDELMKSDPACAAEVLFGLGRVTRRPPVRSGFLMEPAPRTGRRRSKAGSDDVTGRPGAHELDACRWHRGIHRARTPDKPEPGRFVLFPVA